MNIFRFTFTKNDVVLSFLHECATLEDALTYAHLIGRKYGELTKVEQLYLKPSKKYIPNKRRGSAKHDNSRPDKKIRDQVHFKPRRY